MWNPFSKVNVAKLKLLSSQELQEFERQRSEIAQLEKTCKKILHDAKEYGSAVQALNKCETRISQNLLASGFASGTALQNIGESWQKTAGEVEKERTDGLQNFNTVLVEPMKKFSSAFPAWQNGVKKWENHAQDVSKEMSKAEKFKDREQTPANRSKYEQHQKASEYAKEEFTAWHEAFGKDTCKFLENRGDFFRPTMEAVVEVQTNENNHLQRLYSSLCSEIQADAWAASDQVYKNQMQQKLQQLKALTIVASD